MPTEKKAMAVVFHVGAGDIPLEAIESEFASSIPMLRHIAEQHVYEAYFDTKTVTISIDHEYGRDMQIGDTVLLDMGIPHYYGTYLIIQKEINIEYNAIRDSITMERKLKLGES